MSSVYKSALNDLNGTVSFGGGGGGSGSGGSDRQERRNNFHRNRSRGPSLGEMADLNNNGRVTDELAAGATIAAGAVTMKAPGGQVVGGLTIAGGIASYADASR